MKRKDSKMKNTLFGLATLLLSFSASAGQIIRVQTQPTGSPASLSHPRVWDVHCKCETTNPPGGFAEADHLVFGGPPTAGNLNTSCEDRMNAEVGNYGWDCEASFFYSHFEPDVNFMFVK
jgi:hypothetical protein